jgi:hypothetical protein
MLLTRTAEAIRNEYGTLACYNYRGTQSQITVLKRNSLEGLLFREEREETDEVREGDISDMYYESRILDVFPDLPDLPRVTIHTLMMVYNNASTCQHPDYWVGISVHSDFVLLSMRSKILTCRGRHCYYKDPRMLYVFQKRLLTTIS